MTSPINGVTHLNQLHLMKEAAITTADVAHTANASPSTAEFNTLVDLVNQLKAKLNNICKG